MKAPIALGPNVDWKLVAAGTAAVVLLYWLGKREAKAAASAVADAAVTTAKAVGDAVNITAQNNLADRAVDAMTRATAGQTSGASSLGQQIWAWMNPDEWSELRKSLIAPSSR